MHLKSVVAGIGVGVIFASFAALAWTGPTATPPNNNVAAPINVGTVDQIKDAGIGMDSLAVFGNAIISTVSGYLNFGETVGANGYGFRDNAGTMEFKNSGGTWASLNSVIQNYLTLNNYTPGGGGGGAPAWGSITGVPAGFADGVDNTGGIASCRICTYSSMDENSAPAWHCSSYSSGNTFAEAPHTAFQPYRFAIQCQ
jgi:hypothetical protein